MQQNFRQRNDARTRLDAFLNSAPFSAGRLARAANMADQHLSRIRAGESKPKSDTIGRRVRAATQLRGKEVAVTELFDFA